jgi:alkanesulfonate monooxygenase SsuD/methylene tetrahydromethanopterin reductase-like flavin-dependent oxidoreductase (luciferase family)
MIKHGIKGIIGGGAAIGGASDKVVTAWRDALLKAGRAAEMGTDLIIGLSVYIAETQEKAIEEARPLFQENLKMFAPLGFVRGITDEQIEALADRRRAPITKLPTLEEAVEAGSWLCGPPELITEKLMKVQERYPGLDQVNVNQPVGTPQSVILEQLERFAEEVMPAFKSKVTAAANAD